LIRGVPSACIDWQLLPQIGAEHSWFIADLVLLSFSSSS
jgi:hypothetical protein